MRRVWLWTRGLGLWPSFSLLLRRFCIFCDRCWLPGAVHLIRTQTQNFYIGSCQLSPSGSGILRSINQSGYNCPIQWKLGSAPIEPPSYLTGQRGNGPIAPCGVRRRSPSGLAPHLLSPFAATETIHARVCRQSGCGARRPRGGNAGS